MAPQAKGTKAAAERNQPELWAKLDEPHKRCVEFLESRDTKRWVAAEIRSLKERFDLERPLLKAISLRQSAVHVFLRVGNRSNAVILVLTIPLRLQTWQALYFFFEDAGRNKTRWEAFIEGAVSAALREHCAAEGIAPEVFEPNFDVRLDFDCQADTRGQALTREQHREELVKPKGWADVRGSIQPESAVAEFYRRVCASVLPQRPGAGKFSLLQYLGSDFIGPSVQLGELVYSVIRTLTQRAYRLWRMNRREAWEAAERISVMKMLDLFSGSGAITAAAIKAHLDAHGIKVDDATLELNSLCVDLRTAPGQEFLRFHNYAVTFLGQDVYDLPPDLFTQGFDLIVADPPHTGAYKLCEFLAERFGPAVERKELCPSAVVVYFAHGEAERWGEFIINRLSQIKVFDRTYWIRAGGEQLALSIKTPGGMPHGYEGAFEGLVHDALESFKAALVEQYGVAESEVSWTPHDH